MDVEVTCSLLQAIQHDAVAKAVVHELAHARARIRNVGDTQGPMASSAIQPVVAAGVGGLPASQHSRKRPATKLKRSASEAFGL